MQFSYVKLCLLLASLYNVPTLGLQQTPLPVSTVVSYGLGAWVENFGVRASGKLLTVENTSPILRQVNPLDNTAPVTVYTFPVTSLLGITETRLDVFYVVAGNVSATTLAPIKGSFSVWEVDMGAFDATGKPSTVRKVADFPDATLLDGMTTVNADTGLILISDTEGGLIWSLNVNTGKIAQILNLPNMKSVAGDIPAIGVNGLHYTNGILYYTSTDQQLLVRLAINSDGSAAGSPFTIAHNFGQPDDFGFDGVMNAYVAVNSTALALIQPNGAVTVLASPLPGVTAAKFGRTPADSEILYLSTTGGSLGYATGTFTQPGGVLKIDIGAAGYFNYEG